MYRLLRQKYRVVHNQRPIFSAPPELYIVSSTFHLISFVAIACYVMVLTHEGHGLAGAVAAAVVVATSARLNDTLRHAAV